MLAEYRCFSVSLFHRVKPATVPHVIDAFESWKIISALDLLFEESLIYVKCDRRSLCFASILRLLDTGNL